jgi:formylmethanofuran dehydrogenase subunit E
MYNPSRTESAVLDILSLRLSTGGARAACFDHDAFLEEVRRFHGYAAPGVILGGYMVHQARQNLAPGVLYDAVCETAQCLPDAIQLLTPCTVGNGWLRIENFGIFAITLYDKRTGEGFRSHLDVDKLGPFPEIKAWFLKEKAKKDQDSERLADEIRRAGLSILSVRPVRLRQECLGHKSKGRIVRCPLCGTAYPVSFGTICRSCQGETPYSDYPVHSGISPLRLPAVPVAEAQGAHALHDMTRIAPDLGFKGAQVTAGHRFETADIETLRRMGRETVYLAEDAPDAGHWVHEDAVAKAFAEAMPGQGVMIEGPPREGKMNFCAARDGLLLVDGPRLEAFNLLPGVMCATRRSCSLVHQGKRVAGSRAIPLFLPREQYDRALAALAAVPLFQVLPLRRARIGLLVTGSEVYHGLVEDRFAPLIQQKAQQLHSEVVRVLFVPDIAARITRSVRALIDSGADLIVTTGGLSVDPGDVTRDGLCDAGLVDAVHGLPVLPGCMTLVGRILGPRGEVQVLGVPAGALHRKSTALDLLLPRLLAGLRITRGEVARWGNGGLCLECHNCRFPKCPFLH